MKFFKLTEVIAKATIESKVYHILLSDAIKRYNEDRNSIRNKQMIFDLHTAFREELMEESLSKFMSLKNKMIFLDLKDGEAIDITFLDHEKHFLGKATIAIRVGEDLYMVEQEEGYEVLNNEYDEDTLYVHHLIDDAFHPVISAIAVDKEKNPIVVIQKEDGSHVVTFDEYLA